MLEKNIKLLARLLHNPDLLLSQSVQLVDQRVELPVRGLDQAACQGRFFVRRAGLGELFMQGEHSLHLESYVIMAGDVLWAAESISSIEDLSFPEHLSARQF